MHSVLWLFFLRIVTQVLLLLKEQLRRPLEVPNISYLVYEKQYSSRTSKHRCASKLIYLAKYGTYVVICVRFYLKANARIS